MKQFSIRCMVIKIKLSKGKKEEREGGGLPKGDVQSISLFSKMGDKGGGGKKSQKTGGVVCEQPQSENFHCSVLTLVGKLCTSLFTNLQAQNHKTNLSA